MISLRDVVTGFGNRDPLAEVWRRDLRSGGSSAEITGTIPLYFSSRGKPLTDYLISGNTIQDGTPTPEAPVDVVGCGVRTGNLVDPTVRIIDANISSLGRIEDYIPGNYDLGYFQIIQGNTYTIDSYVYAFYDTIPTRSSVAYDNQRVIGEYGRPSSFTAPITGYCCFRVDYGDSFMANTGSTALPYEPYGYKLPLTVNGTEYPIYLGQVETTRRIKKLVLTGEENWSLWESGQTDVERYYYKWGKTTPSDYGLICTHFRFIRGDGNYEHIRIGGNNFDDFIIFISKTIAPTVADFKSYLADQYAAGTPVTVWYVRATPENAIVNEPLMKIGDYADTVSFAQAEVVIPTVNGANVLDMTSPVKPSEVYIKGKGIKPTNDPNFENGG